MLRSISPAGLRDGVSLHGDPGPIRHAFTRAIGANDDQPPAVQVLGVAAAFVLMAETAGLDPHELVNRVRRMSTDLDGPFTSQWQAMKDYVRGEVLR